MPYFAYNVGGWVQKEGKICLRNKSMAPQLLIYEIGRITLTANYLLIYLIATLLA